MRVITIAVASLSLVLIALTLLPSAGSYRSYLSVGALVCALIVLVLVGLGGRDGRGSAPVARHDAATPAATLDREPKTQAASGSDARSAVTTAPAIAREAEIVGLLAILQDKGRLVDFLQDDIGNYTDAQVGAAARVVHQGCKAVLHEYFAIVPVREENEGSRVTVAAGYAPDEYRLVGKISGQAPFSGTLVHRGWKAGAVTLPRILAANDRRLPTIAPAEVELR